MKKKIEVDEEDYDTCGLWSENVKWDYWKAVRVLKKCCTDGECLGEESERDTNTMQWVSVW